MTKLKKFSVVWIDRGNCEIAEVEIEAYTLAGALVPAPDMLTKKQFAAVQKEAVSVVVKEL